MSSLAEGRRIIRGEAVYFRPAERADLPTFVRWSNDAEVTRHLAMYAPMSEAAEEGWFERMLAAHERTLRRAHFSRGEHHDVHVMSLLCDEWARLPHRRSWEYD